jgi:hypothetical protein
MDLRKNTLITNRLLKLRFGNILPLCYVLFFFLLQPFVSTAHRLPRPVPAKQQTNFQHLSEDDEKLSPCTKIGQKAFKLSKKYRSVNEYSACLQPSYRRVSVRHTDPATRPSYYEPAFFPLEQHCFLYRLTYF